VVWIESRGGKLGYRVAGALRDQLLVDPPQFNRSADSLLQELEGTLISRGLYEDEARAMIATWRNSWFEEGSRLLYFLPGRAVNGILPLAVSPAPASTVRVFVGRLELVTPATERAVRQAFAWHDQAELDKYKRFLEPILKGMLANAQADPTYASKLQGYLNSVYSYSCRSPWPERR